VISGIEGITPAVAGPSQEGTCNIITTLHYHPDGPSYHPNLPSKGRNLADQQDPPGRKPKPTEPPQILNYRARTCLAPTVRIGTQ